MWTGHRPLWRDSKTGLTSSPVEAQSPCVREESPDFRHGEYVKTVTQMSCDIKDKVKFILDFMSGTSIG